MSKFFDGINAFFKAQWWSGASWLILLCAIHAVTSGIYVCLHLSVQGHEMVQLDADQTKTLNDLLAIYPDSQLPTSILREYADRNKNDLFKLRLADSITYLRIQRTSVVRQFLATAYHGEVGDGQLDSLTRTLPELNTKDAITYLQAKKFRVSSFFWLSGGLTYWEALLWSFIGVITSLIYYVSVANQLYLKNTRDDDIGPFDTSEISAQVAKMFYAPVITLVVVLGYNYFTGNNKGVVNISVNHGLIIFSFIAGFYSGRLMKLLDNVKNLILPVSSDGNPPLGPGKAVTTGNITVQLGLSTAIGSSPDGPAINKAGFGTAVVSLKPSTGGADAVPLVKPVTDPGSVFTGTGVAFGNYTLTASYTFKKDPSPLNLTASKEITIDAQHLSFSLDLDKTASVE